MSKIDEREIDEILESLTLKDIIVMIKILQRFIAVSNMARKTIARASRIIGTPHYTGSPFGMIMQQLMQQTISKTSEHEESVEDLLVDEETARQVIAKLRKTKENKK